MYDKDEEKRKYMKKMNDSSKMNLQTLIADGILDFVSSIKVIAVVRNLFNMITLKGRWLF